MTELETDQWLELGAVRGEMNGQEEPNTDIETKKTKTNNEAN